MVSQQGHKSRPTVRTLNRESLRIIHGFSEGLMLTTIKEMPIRPEPD